MKNIFFKKKNTFFQRLMVRLGMMSGIFLLGFILFLGVAKYTLDHADLHPPLPEVCEHGIIFHHGFFPLLSMHRFAKELRDLDGLCVVSTELSPALPIAERAAQLKDFVDTFRALKHPQKISIVGHSQGGLDARALISIHGYGEYIDQVITLATPHRGSVVAYRMHAYLYWTALHRIVNPMVAFLFSYDGPVDVMGILRDLQNKSFPFEDDPRVRYRSFAGVCGMGTPNCWVDIFHFPQNVLLYWSEGINDSVVSLESARWGESLVEVSTTHAGFVGYRKLLGSFDFDPMAFYRDLVWQILELR